MLLFNTERILRKKDVSKESDNISCNFYFKSVEFDIGKVSSASESNSMNHFEKGESRMIKKQSSAYHLYKARIFIMSHPSFSPFYQISYLHVLHDVNIRCIIYHKNIVCKP